MEKKVDPYLIPDQISSRWTTVLNMRAKTIKLLFLCYFLVMF